MTFKTSIQIFWTFSNSGNSDSDKENPASVGFKNQQERDFWFRVAREPLA